MLHPTDQEIHAAIRLIESGSLEDAELHLIDLVERYPEDPFPWKAISVVLFNQGKLIEALKSMQEVVHIAPDDAEGQSNLGALLSELGRKDEALPFIRRAVELRPTLAEGHYNLGNSLKDLGLYHQAEESYREALRLRPDFSDALCNLGVTLKLLLKEEDAATYFKKALEITPTSAEVHFNFGNLLHDQGDFESAIHSYDNAIRLKDGHYPEAHCNIGISYRAVGRFKDAEFHIRQSLKQNPDNAEVHNNLGVMLNELGRVTESERCLREAIRQRPDSPAIRSNLLFLLSASCDHPQSLYLEEARQFGLLVTALAKSKFVYEKPNPYPGRLRVGFVSGDFRNHPVGYFIESIASNIDATRIEMVAFSTNLILDELTERLIPFFSKWQPIYGLDDQTAAKMIHGMVDILIDLSGHTEHNRLPVFAYRSAPIQISWLGYWASTGVAEMDYLIGDPIVTPQERDADYIEKVWRLQSTRFCYTPPHHEVQVEPPPLLHNGYVTFGSFNKLNKLTDDVIAVWSKILLGVPNAMLFLKAKQFHDAEIRTSIERRFQAHGVESNRLILEGDSSRIKYLEAYNRVDIALDPFPFPGGTTSADALWMGVPVLTRKGNSLISRQGEGIAICGGLTDWIAEDEKLYIEKGILFATNQTLLVNIKKNLRQNVIGSPLFDSKCFAREFEDACWSLWMDYCHQMGVDVKVIPRLNFSHMQNST